MTLPLDVPGGAKPFEKHMSNQRLLAIGFLLIGAAAAFVLERITDLLLGWAGIVNGDVFGGIHLSSLIGIALAGALATVAWVNPKVQEAGQGVAGELRKVTWPTWPELKAATAAVLVVTVVAALILGLLDFVSAKIMSDWIPSGIRWAQGLLG